MRGIEVSLFKRVQINVHFILLGNSLKTFWGYCGQEYHKPLGNTAGERFPEISSLCNYSNGLLHDRTQLILRYHR